MNGKEIDIADGARISALLETLALSDLRVAVEHNRVIVQKEKYPEVTLREGDSVEIISFVGGG